MTKVAKDRVITVWHVFGAMDIGGAELRTLELAAALAADGIRFEYVTLSGREGALADRILESGSQIRPMGLSPVFPVRFLWTIHRHRPQAVDSHVATFSGLLLLLAWLGRVPVRIAHFRSDGDGHLPTRSRRAQRAVMTWLIRRFATDIVGVSPSSLSLGYRADWMADARAQVIPNGLGPSPEVSQLFLRKSLQLGSDSLLLMHVGRASPEKNRPQAVSVLAAMREAGHDAHLVLLGGDGVDAGEMKDRSKALGMDDYIHELGRRHDVRSLMAQADALVLTSTREGLPGVVLESLSVGTPVVSTPLPGVTYIKASVPGVATVEASDLNGWVSSLRAATKGLGPSERERIRRGFQVGPFSLQRSCVAHSEIYTRGVAR